MATRSPARGIYNVDLTGRQLDGERLAVLTDRQGRFRFVAAPGGHRVEVEGTAVASNPFSLGAGKVERIDLVGERR
jgi:hypothetical protein